MHFKILGNLQILRDDGTHIVIPQARLRSLLTVLLIHNGLVTSTERLGCLLWGTDIPVKSDHAIHAYISALRRALRPVDIIRNDRPGYRLELAPHLLDVDEFHELRALGTAAFNGRSYGHATFTLERACALWRNPTLPDFPRSSSMRGIAAQLGAELNATQDLLIDARLASGQHRDVIPMLRAKTVEQPGHELSWIQLMIALYRSDMRSMALNVYIEARDALRNSSGIDPGPSLQHLHEQILKDAPALFGNWRS